MIVEERMRTFINSLDPGEPAWLDEIRSSALQDNVPIIRMEMGSLLRFLLTLRRPSSILEVGTAVGYSALFMSEYMPENCHITTIEKYEKRIPIAKQNFKTAGREDKITLLEGDAAEILAELSQPFDFIFMDAAKGQYMHFLPDVYVPCEVCKGARYNRETLEVKYKEKTISDVLNMTVEEAVVFFANQPKIARKLQTLLDVGLGYVTLGQSATTLSGGEAQRVKLANELARRSTGKTVYILDEPTTGLHMADVHRLIEVLQKLVDAGNTVIVIEHNLDLIKCADHIIDLGPEGGSAGGLIVAEGTPEQVAEVPGSFTGQYLKPLLEKDAKLRAEGK